MDHEQRKPVFPNLQPLHFVRAEVIKTADKLDTNHGDEIELSVTLCDDEFHSVPPPVAVRPSQELASPSGNLERFEFFVATISRQSQGTNNQWTIQHERHSAHRYIEILKPAYNALASQNLHTSIFQQLISLSLQQFKQLLSRLEIAPAALPLPTAPYDIQVLTLLKWAQGSPGVGITRIKAALHDLIVHSPESVLSSVHLEMVSLPGGNFMMGAPDDEPPHYKHERPQHPVNVQPFSIGRYPITQAQWLVVSTMDPVNIAMHSMRPELDDADADSFPVATVDWEQAVEFCDRISRHTGRTYRLPTEAEWEYACRAGTETPFHFGETISPELANYRGPDSYNGGPEGIKRPSTTPVDYFGVANAFGLSDMHGNVFEWCLDRPPLFRGYKGAPTDGSDWLSDVSSTRYVYRGGSWRSGVKGCRSAFRHGKEDGRCSSTSQGDVGFRVVCSAPFS